MTKFISIGVFFLFKLPIGIAQINTDSTHYTKWTNHFQLTAISQSDLAFKAPYSGKNSLSPTAQNGATSISSTLFLGRKLWKNGAFYFNPEISGGSGLSFSQGVAGALNGETYRVGNVAPSFFIARAYFQETVAVGSKVYEQLDDDENQIKEKVPANRISIIAGKFAISDFYDNNIYSHNPRTQFLNWALMSNGAWDYPADTRGYTFGMITKLITPKWSIAISSVAVPRIANHPEMEYRISNAHSETVELERKITLTKRPGALRVFLSDTHSKAPSYAQGMKALAANDTYILDVISGNAEGKSYGGKKTGLGFSGEQELNNELGIFMRTAWNDGKYATWAFTEIDRTFSCGVSIKGNRWKRSGDVIGIGAAINGLSTPHRNFLKAGGYGFIIGDGHLNYGAETILETYYNAFLSHFFWLTIDYQLVDNPAYNKDRGPVNAFAIRGHIAF